MKRALDGFGQEKRYQYFIEEYIKELNYFIYQDNNIDTTIEEIQAIMEQNKQEEEQELEKDRKELKYTINIVYDDEVYGTKKQEYTIMDENGRK